MGFSRQGYWSGLLCPPPGDLPNPGMEPVSLTINLHWQAGSLPLAPPGKPQAGRGPLKYPGLSPTFSIDLSLCDLFLQWNNLYFQLHPCPCHQCGHTQPISKVPGSKVQWPGRGCQTLLARTSPASSFLDFGVTQHLCPRRPDSGRGVDNPGL